MKKIVKKKEVTHRKISCFDVIFWKECTWQARKYKNLPDTMNPLPTRFLGEQICPGEDQIIKDIVET